MSLMVQPAERIMKDPRAKVVHNERKGDVLFWKLASSSTGRKSAAAVVALDTMSSSRRDMDDVGIVGNSMFDVVVVDEEADDDANATDHRHGCKRRNVPIGLSIRERRA